MTRFTLSALVLFFVELISFPGFYSLRKSQAADLPGDKVYRRLCAKCHGLQGEGVNEHYPDTLTGDWSIDELSKYIDESMPLDDPDQCSAEESKLVATYMHEAFYSPIAQARIRPPRIELARLTVHQYQHTLADLIGSFRGKSHWGVEHGLKGEYFKSRRYRNEDRVFERVDSTVKFDFGEESPEKGKIEPAEFAIRWQGSVFAPETGVYEFLLQSDNGSRLWINNNETPLVDAWVQSGTDLERGESIRLIGGRAYPLKLEMFKSKEAKEKRAGIRLKWRLPHRASEVIPSRFLYTHRVNETFILQTPFPPDDRSEGYERGNSITKEWEQASTDAALEVVGYLSQHFKDLIGGRFESNERASLLRVFCLQFAERAFRRPLSEEERELFVDRHFVAVEGQQANSETPVAENLEKDKQTSDEVQRSIVNARILNAAKRSLILILKSPRFLFREIGSQVGDPFDVASRLSYAMWDSLPDEKLMQLAATRELLKEDRVRLEAERMLADPRARAKLREFFLLWLRVEHLTDISKDSRNYPDFSPSVLSDLRSSLDLFLDDVLDHPLADFRDLFLSDTVYLNGNLAAFYDVDLPLDAEFQRIPLDADNRAGVLTHPYLMSGFAYTSASSPIHRGVFLARSVLGRLLRPPPEAVPPLSPDLHAGLTTRERVALQTQAASCQTCHGMINPLGFTLESFDAVGRFRREELSKVIDSTGTYRTRSGELKEFSNARELAKFLVETEETQLAIVSQMFHHLVKQPILAYGVDTPVKLRDVFHQNQWNLRKLMVEIVVKAALTERLGQPATNSVNSTD